MQNGDEIFISSYILEKFKNIEVIESEKYIPNKNLLERLKSSILYEDSNLIVLNNLLLNKLSFYFIGKIKSLLVMLIILFFLYSFLNILCFLDKFLILCKVYNV